MNETLDFFSTLFFPFPQSIVSIPWCPLLTYFAAKYEEIYIFNENGYYVWEEFNTTMEFHLFSQGRKKTCLIVIHSALKMENSATYANAWKGKVKHWKRTDVLQH